MTFPLYNFLIQNLAGCFVTAIANVSVIFTFFLCWNRRKKFSKSKNRQSTILSGCCFSPKEVEKLFDFDFHKLHNMTNVFEQNLGFYRARFSIQNLFKTTPCPLKRQRENHTCVLASDSSHEDTVDQRSKTYTQTNQAICTYVLSSSKTLINQKNLSS